MATNISHVRAAFDALYAKAEAAKEAIENKDTVTDHDEERISAYDTFLNDIETAMEDLTSELEG